MLYESMPTGLDRASYKRFATEVVRSTQQWLGESPPKPKDEDPWDTGELGRSLEHAVAVEQMVRGKDGKFQNPLKPKDEPAPQGE
jgi:hypothetical protein